MPQSDAGKAVLRNDTAPYGVVQVEHEALPAQAEICCDDRGRMSGQQREGVEGHGLLREVPVARIVPTLFADERRESFTIHDGDGGARCGAKAGVDRLGHHVTGSRKSGGEMPCGMSQGTAKLCWTIRARDRVVARFQSAVHRLTSRCTSSAGPG